MYVSTLQVSFVSCLLHPSPCFQYKPEPRPNTCSVFENKSFLFGFRLESSLHSHRALAATASQYRDHRVSLCLLDQGGASAPRLCDLFSPLRNLTFSEMAFTYSFFLESPFGGLTLPSRFPHLSLWTPLLQAIWEDQLSINVNKSKTHFINRSKIHLYYPGLDKIRDSFNPFRRRKP